MLATIPYPTGSLAAFGNLLGPDTLIIFLIILVFFGAKKLPELARSLGQAMREFSKAKDEFEREITRPPDPEAPKQIPPPATTTETKVEESQPSKTDPVVSERPDVSVHPPETVSKQ